jgi:amidohydrolase
VGAVWEARLDEIVAELEPRLVEVRRFLHAHPEPSGEEVRTTLYVREPLDAAGYAIRFGPDGRGLIVDDPDAPPGPRAAVRGDMDALPIQDQKDAPYRSREPGVMHACGHDAHTSIALGVMLALRQARQEGVLPWPVPCRGVFQPAEETGEGALGMMSAGALDDVAAIFSVHVDPSREVGRIGYRWGAFTAACDDLTIRIDGRGGHAARPHESRDPIAAAAQLINSLYLFIPRGTDTHDPVVFTFGQVQAGESNNVIPEFATLGGTLRTLGGATRERTREHVERIAAALGEASGTQVAVTWGQGPPSVDNDKELTTLLRDAATDLLGSDCVDIIPRPSMGGEDFAYYQTRVPGVMFRLGCTSPRTSGAPLHSPKFDVDERALGIGARVLARSIVRWADPARGGAA